MSISSDTTPQNLHSPQRYSTIPPSRYTSSPGRGISASVPGAQTGLYPSRAPSSPSTSFRRSCKVIEEEEEEEEDSTSVEPQDGPFPITPRRDIGASMPSPQTGPYRSRTPSSPSTSFIRCLGTLAEEEDEEEEEEWTSMQPQGSLFSGCDISTSVPSAQAGPYPSRTPSSPSTSFIRRLCTLIEEGEEE